MLETENIPFYPKNEQLNTNISNQNINRNLNLKENEKDEKYSNKDEQQDHSSEDENLGYNSKYSLNKKNKYNMDNSNLEDTSLKSKASTVSTGISQNEVYLEQINLLYPGNLKMEKNDRKESFTMYNNINFTRERLNSTPITITIKELIIIYVKSNQKIIIIQNQGISSKKKNFSERMIFLLRI